MATKKDKLLETFLDLSRVPSPSRHEKAVATVVRDKLKEIGLTCEEDKAADIIGGDCGNLLVRLPGTKGMPRLFLSAHMDTVETVGSQPAEPRFDGDKWIYSERPGIIGADDKSGVAVLLELLSRLKKNKPKHGDLLVGFTVCEEIQAQGSACIDEDVYAGYDAGIVLDHSLPNEIIIGAPTKVAFRIEVKGVGGHAAFPATRVNAAHTMAKVVSRLPTGRLDSMSTCNIGIVQSGTAINVIPEKAYAEYEIRSHRKDVLDFHVKRTLGIIEAAVRECRILPLESGGGLGDDDATSSVRERSAVADVEVEVSFEGFKLTPDEPSIQTLVRAVSAVGLTPELIVAQGGSDANIFNKRGLPCTVIGCGMHGAHGSKERANLEEMRQAVDVLYNVVTEG